MAIQGRRVCSGNRATIGGALIESMCTSIATITMAQPFVHATASRRSTASVLVELSSGTMTGWGEGAPRNYVTGETTQTVVAALERVDLDDLNAAIDFSGIEQSLLSLEAFDIGRLLGGCFMPAAEAALEIAAFDFICRLHNLTAIEALHVIPEYGCLLRTSERKVPVSFVVDLAKDVDSQLRGISAHTIASIRHVKIKANSDIRDSVDRVAQIRNVFGTAARLSVDVNGVWNQDEAIRASSMLATSGVAWLEEPVARRDWDAMQAIRRSGMSVMIDESCSSETDLREAAARGAADYVNIRVSKFGGIFPTLRMLNTAKALGLKSQLGVHVGEIGPLWSAGRLLACSVTGLTTVEAGKHDQWFPDPLTIPRNEVDRNEYTVRPIQGPGLGLTPSTALRQWISTEHKKVSTTP